MDVREFVPVRAMKAFGVNTGTYPLILYRRCLEGGGGELHDPAAIPHGKEPSLRFEQVSGWAPELA